VHEPRLAKALGRAATDPHPERGYDAARLLAWRNDPETRRWSRTSHTLQPEEHAGWLQRKLADASTQLWLAEHEGSPVAQVRVESERDGTAEIHVAVAPDARGQGVGSAARALAATRALAQPGAGVLCTHVKPGNDASLRAFARAGFRVAAKDADGLVRLERTPARPEQTASGERV